MSDETYAYRFADLLLDPANRRLTRGETEIYLPPKTFDTLVLLVERHGRVVTKQAFLDAVWTDTAVTDNALTQRISELRESLGDDAHRPRFIRTLPRVGFTFIAPVGRIPAADVAATARLGDAGSSGDREADWAGAAGAGRAWLAHSLQDRRLRARRPRVRPGGGWTAWWVGRPAVRQSASESTFPGSHRSPSLSPDGNDGLHQSVCRDAV